MLSNFIFTGCVCDLKTCYDKTVLFMETVSLHKTFLRNVFLKNIKYITFEKCTHKCCVKDPNT